MSPGPVPSETSAARLPRVVMSSVFRAASVKERISPPTAENQGNPDFRAPAASRSAIRMVASAGISCAFPCTSMAALLSAPVFTTEEGYRRSPRKAAMNAPFPNWSMSTFPAREEILPTEESAAARDPAVSTRHRAMASRAFFISHPLPSCPWIIVPRQPGKFHCPSPRTKEMKPPRIAGPRGGCDTGDGTSLRAVGTGWSAACAAYGRSARYL